MMCQRYLKFVFVWVIALLMQANGAYAEGSADPVKVRLLQSVDERCDGYSYTMSSSAVMPGACIRYHLIVTNTGDLPVASTHVAAFVPEHTKLYMPLKLVSGRSLVSDASEESYSPTVLGMRLGQMQSGSVTLHYAVRVDQ